MEFNTEFLLFSSLGTSIYRLMVQMSVWTILALWMSASGWESTSSRRLQQSSNIYVLERNPEALVEH
jgi:hypothetical protein